MKSFQNGDAQRWVLPGEVVRSPEPGVSGPDNRDVAREVAGQSRPGRWAAAQRVPPEGNWLLAGRSWPGHKLGGLMIHSTRAVFSRLLATPCVAELRYSMLSALSGTDASSS